MAERIIILECSSVFTVSLGAACCILPRMCGTLLQPLHTKLVLQKKKAKEGRPKEEDVENQFPVPSRVTVRRRDLTEEELRVKDESRLALLEV